jgi:hypothetical protein
MYNGLTILPIVNKIVGHKQCFTTHKAKLVTDMTPDTTDFQLKQACINGVPHSILGVFTIILFETVFQNHLICKFVNIQLILCCAVAAQKKFNIFLGVWIFFGF